MNRISIAASCLLLAACGGTEAPAASAAEASNATATAGTGTVIEVRTITDEKGNRFEPAKLHARQGDVLRFILVSGVHNASFPVASNPAGAALPAAADMLQLPGQTFDLPVTFAPGTYHFQCDPHAALGMVGELEVE